MYSGRGRGCYQPGKLDHVTQVMGYHQTYLEIFLRTQNFIMRGDGPLPFDYRNYIAIMAAGRHQCSYLINLQKTEFLRNGGNKEWLKGLQYIPRKLYSLYEINKLLAHRPWLIDDSHIQKLTKSPDCWSLSEIVHAMVLLVHFHSLSSFVYSCGLNEKLDNLPNSGNGNNNNSNGNSNSVGDTMAAAEAVGEQSKKSVTSAYQPFRGLGWRRTKDIKKNESEDYEVGLDALMERMKNLPDKFSGNEADRVKSFEHVESQPIELPSTASKSSLLKRDVGLFVHDPDFRYDDSAKRTKSGLIIFKVQDYSWDDHGFSLANRLYNDVGNLLDQKFKTSYNLTYYTMGGVKDVDTTKFRRAIWNYIQCVFGIRHDDYNYQEINQLLTRSLKAFIKVACCCPERITKKDYDNVMKQLQHSEKVHINLMILEARMQAELLYGLRAVMPFMI